MTYYASLKNGVMLRAENALIIDGEVVNRPTTEQYLAMGYKPVIFADHSEAPEGYHYEARWSEEETAIIQTWVLVEGTDDPTAEEILDIILGGDGE